MSLRRRAAQLACCALLTVPLAACGNKTATTTFADQEGAYLDLGQLKYQVQISRELNPFDNEDKAYLQGLPRGEKLGNDEAWYGVFLRVENGHDNSLPAASDFELKDTQDNVFTPVPLARTNVFAYRAGNVPGNGQLPLFDSPAYSNPSVRGLLVLFKVKELSFDNRPLELLIKSPTVPQSEVGVDLDV